MYHYTNVHVFICLEKVVILQIMIIFIVGSSLAHFLD